MKKFKQHIEEMSMSVTLKPKKNNMYKVTGVGKKMAAHGGIKKGEKFHDSEIDGMNDSGIKVKYQKPNMKKESNSSMDQMADTYRDHEDHKDKTVQKHIKKAKKAYDSGDNEGFYNHTQNAADHAHSIRKEQVVNELSGKTLSNYIQKSANPVKKNSAVNLASRGGFKLGQADMHDIDAGEKEDKKAFNRGQGMQRAAIKLQKKMYGKKTNEAIERRADRKTIIATDPATGRKVVKVAPKKEIKIGRGKMESVVNERNTAVKLDPRTIKMTLGKAKPIPGHPDYKGPQNPEANKKPKLNVSPGNMKKVNEISDTTKLSYINKANKAITDREKLHLKIGAKVDKDKTLEKMRKGVAMAKSKLGEDLTPMQMYELKISTMQKYKQAANKDVQDGENARHKGYPEKAIDKQQDKRYKGIDTANKRIDKKQVKMAKGVAFDKRYKGGNMTGASNAINKIKPGLADHPKVKDALRRANESIGE